MSTAEDYRPCRDCGALTDGDVCSSTCADDLDREAEAKQAEEWAANGRCSDCGELLSGNGYCADCGE